MPRGRGAGGVAVYKAKVYYAGGLHDGIAVPWFDVYDPAMNTWTALPDMPRARDHFHGAVVGDRFYAIGGGNRDVDATTAANDAYDFVTGAWVTGLAPLPTARGGFATAVLSQVRLGRRRDARSSPLRRLGPFHQRRCTPRVADRRLDAVARRRHRRKRAPRIRRHVVGLDRCERLAPSLASDRSRTHPPRPRSRSCPPITCGRRPAAPIRPRR